LCEERFQIGQLAEFQQPFKLLGQFCLYAVIAGKLQQAHDDLARIAWAQCLIQALPGPAVRLTRKQIVTKHEAPEGLRFAFE
jgi:hypothetical protein